MKSPITTHVLDTATGRPAAGLAITLERLVEESWTRIGAGVTNADGRITDLLRPEDFSAADYRMRFATGDWFTKQETAGFYPYVEVVFRVTDPASHHHVPLLLSPFGFSTYRGS